jgi:hypothetical protein
MTRLESQFATGAVVVLVLLGIGGGGIYYHSQRYEREAKRCSAQNPNETCPSAEFLQDFDTLVQLNKDLNTPDLVEKHDRLVGIQQRLQGELGPDHKFDPAIRKVVKVELPKPPPPPVNPPNAVEKTPAGIVPAKK